MVLRALECDAGAGSDTYSTSKNRVVECFRNENHQITKDLKSSQKVYESS